MKTVRRWIKNIRRCVEWLKSRTISFNAYSLTLIPVLEYARAELPAVRELVPDSTYKYLMIGILVANLWLRVLTTQPVTTYEKKPSDYQPEDEEHA